MTSHAEGFFKKKKEKKNRLKSFFKKEKKKYIIKRKYMKIKEARIVEENISIVYNRLQSTI